MGGRLVIWGWGVGGDMGVGGANGPSCTSLNGSYKNLLPPEVWFTTRGNSQCMKSVGWCLILHSPSRCGLENVYTLTLCVREDMGELWVVRWVTNWSKKKE